MFVQIKCSFCGQPFDFDSSSDERQADCPHCGKKNTLPEPAGAAKTLEIQHGAPNLSGAKPCPACKAQTARDAVICIHCGYNFATQKKIGGESWFAANQTLIFLTGGGLILLALSAAYLFWPEKEIPLPVALPAEPVVAQSVPAPVVTPPAAPAVPDIPPPPPEPTPEELAAQKAEAERIAREAEEARLQAERAAFEAKKAQAEITLRRQLDAREPLYQINESVELRRKNGVFDKGTLTSFSGTGTGRVALVATALGEIGVPLVALDNPTRRRIDSEYREAFIQHLLSTRAPPAASAQDQP